MNASVGAGAGQRRAAALPRERLLVKECGRVPYETTYRAMQRFTAARDPLTGDELWLVEHPPVYTLGLAGKPEHVLREGDIPIVRADRGGQVTYHGPGQAIAYALLDLRRRNIAVRRLVWLLEQATIEMLVDFRVAGERRVGAPGVYVAGAKVAALGLRVRGGCCYHGIAVNVDVDLAPYADINPCGYPGLAVTRLADLAPEATVPVVGRALATQLDRLLTAASRRPS